MKIRYLHKKLELFPWREDLNPLVTEFCIDLLDEMDDHRYKYLQGNLQTSQDTSDCGDKDERITSSHVSEDAGARSTLGVVSVIRALSYPLLDE